MGTTKTNASLEQKLRVKNASSGLGELFMARAVYNFATDGGAAAAIAPKKNATLPANAVIVGGTINATTTLAGALSNIEIGTDAGSSATSILGSTAKASLAGGDIVNAVPTFAAPVKLTALGKIILTPDGTISAGVIEVTLFFYVAKA